MAEVNDSFSSYTCCCGYRARLDHSVGKATGARGGGRSSSHCLGRP